MGAVDLAQLAAQFGLAGPFVGYLIWREKAERAERRDLAQIRADIDKAEIASRERLASSLTALSMVIQGRPNV